MEVAGVIVSFIGSVTQIISYANTVKRAPEDRRQLESAAASLLSDLVALKHIAEGLGALPNVGRFLESQEAQDIKGEIEQLNEKMKKKESRLRELGNLSTWPFKKGDLDGILAKISRLQTSLVLHQQMDHVAISKDTNTRVKEIQESQRTEKQVQEQRMIEEWLSPFNFEATQTTHNSKIKKVEVGKWLFDTQEFKTWVGGKGKTLLCMGHAGTGKTILTSAVIEYVKRKFRNDENVAVAWIYCEYNSKNEQNPSNFIGSLLKQLIQKRSAVPDHVGELYYTATEDDTEPDYDDLIGALKLMLGGYSSAFIVVDALDECDYNEIICALRPLFLHANWMVTSRPKSEIKNQFTEAISLEVRARGDDVARYLKDRLAQPTRLRILTEGDDSLEDEIIRAITAKCDARFLLAVLHMDSIIRKSSKGAVREALLALPRDLSGAYKKSREMIDSQHKEDSELAWRIISWVSFATRPLSLSELQHALAVKEGCGEITADALPHPEIINSVCAGIIVFDGHNSRKTISPIHYTAREYFKEICLDRFPNIQTQIAEACLNYLSLDSLKESCSTDESFERRLRESPLFDYAVRNWSVHCRKTAWGEIKDSVLRFLADASLVKASSQVLLTPNRISNGYSQHFPVPFSGLHLAVYFGWEHLTRELLDSCYTDLEDLKDGFNQTPLSWAAQEGHLGIVTRLLEPHIGNKIEVNSVDLSGHTPLLRATSRQQVHVVRKLLATPNVDPDIRNSKMRTPLSRASANGYFDIVQELLSRPEVRARIDINSRNRRNRTSLSWAAERGHLNIVKLLLDNNADASIEDIAHKTALIRATEQGHLDVAEILIEAEEHPSRQGTSRGTDLVWAEGGTHLDAVKHLETKVNPDEKQKWEAIRQGILRWALRNSYLDVIKFLLLEVGVNSTKQDKRGRTYLTYAAYKGDAEAVEILLAAEGGSCQENNPRKIALSIALAGGHQKVVDVLLKAEVGQDEAT